VVGDEPEDPLSPLFPFPPTTEPPVSIETNPAGREHDEIRVVIFAGQSAAIAEKLSAPIHANAMVCIVNRKQPCFS
jgi:hypothetical protein